MRRAIIIVLSLLLLTILEIILSETIQSGLHSYITYLDWQSFTVDFAIGFVVAIIVALLYFLAVRSWIKYNLLLQGAATGVTTVIFFYLFSALANGIAVNFNIPPITLIIRTFALGFIFPFLIFGIGKLIRPFDTKRKA